MIHCWIDTRTRRHTDLLSSATMLKTTRDGSRLVVRDGGGVLAVFGVPFAAAGLFLWAALLGVVPTGNPPRPLSGSWFALALMATVFASVGLVMVLGRRWVVADTGARTLRVTQGLLVPMTGRSIDLSDVRAIALTRTRGDSDSSDTFPVRVNTVSGPPLLVAAPTDFALARACAAAIAAHVGVPLQDGTSDHTVTLAPSDVDRPLTSRRTAHANTAAPIERPATLRSVVDRDGDGVRIAIPNRQPNTLLALLAIVPGIVPLLVVPSLRTFFTQTHTPPMIGGFFVAFLVIGFVVLPIALTVSGYLRARLGSTRIAVAGGRLVLSERGVFRTATQLDVPLDDVLDIDFSTSASLMARATEETRQQLATGGTALDQLQPGSRTMKMVNWIARHAKGRGLTLKTKAGVIETGGWLEDDEVQYLASVIRRAVMQA